MPTTAAMPWAWRASISARVVMPPAAAAQSQPPVADTDKVRRVASIGAMPSVVRVRRAERIE